MTSKTFTKPQQVMAFVIVLMMLGLYGYVVWVFQPLLRSVNELSEKVRYTSAQLQQVQQLVAQEGTVRKDYAQLTSSVTKLRTALPLETELPSVIQLLSDLADQSGVKIVSILPQRAVEHAEATQKSGKVNVPAPLYREIPIEIEAVTGFHQLGMLLSRVESTAQPMQIKKLEIAAGQQELKRQAVTILLIAYFAMMNDRAPGGGTAGGT